MNDPGTTRQPTRKPRPGYWARLGKRLADTWPLLVCGLGIGFLTGLSTTPGVSATVISVILSLTAALAAVMSGFRPLPGDRKAAAVGKSPGGVAAILAGLRIAGPNAIGIMLLVVGIVLGACTGIYFRAHNTLGIKRPTPTKPIGPAEEVSTASAAGKPVKAPGQSNLPRETVLFSNLSAGDKVRLKGLTRANVVTVAAGCESRQVQRFAEVFKDEPDQLLRIIQEVLLWEQGPGP